ncbi:LPXTG cell wall anchor domain-containing protein [Micromonospora sp. NPDC093277]|uniref:LPXTG cell wall anchor domain-containing protein n=1 Tax=Micromonospora sp. NPDC093277 TaxID=3364291 RepID=UPI0037FF1F77
MPQRRRVARAGFTAAAATACLALATPAWAATITHPVLHQANQHILASSKGYDQGFGKCTGKTTQNANEDVWVFVWPGNGVQSIDAMKIGWDTDNNGTADTFRTLADGHLTTDNGAKKVWFATPAGWKLETGESTVHGSTPQNFFNLTHTCAAKTGQSPSPSPSTPGEETPTPTPSTPGEETPTPTPSTPGEETPTPSPSTPGEETPTPTPGESDDTSETPSPSSSVGGGSDNGGGLPLTGVAATSIALTGLALIGGGVVLMVLRRRRDKITFTS